jgi:hypothetical protein
MDLPVECTHCKVIMTSWSAPGSPVRYYQCPFCARTFCSAYGEVFRRRAGARLVERRPPAAGSPSPAPLPTPDEIRWKELKSRAARWFARLEAEEQRTAYACASCGPRAPSRQR